MKNMASLRVPITQRDGNPKTSTQRPSEDSSDAVLPWGRCRKILTVRRMRELLTTSGFGEAFAPALEFRRGKDCHTRPQKSSSNRSLNKSTN
jgi:hypothetical protein